MAFRFRNLQYESREDSLTELCSPYCDPQNNPSGYCPPECTLFCNPSCYFPYPQLPPDVTTTLVDYPEQQQQQKTPLFLIFITITITTFLICCTTICCKAFFSSRTEPSGQQPGTDGRDHENLDQARQPVVDHPIWSIRSVGLESSVISSINKCKYKRGDGVVEGTECAVCLSEFQEDENLRLLPTCKHAFHIACIDKWLKSHTNCPICRADIVINPVGIP